jgi:multicomponent Na+:H+ antiporter subunit D
MLRSAPLVAVLFIVPALSLVGIPPLSGFVPKFALVDAAAAESQWVVLGVALLVSLLTLVSMMKIWSAVFWAPATDGDATARDGGRLGGPPLMVVPTIVLVGLTVAVGIAAGPLFELSERAAADLLDPSLYVERVLGGGG